MHPSARDQLPGTDMDSGHWTSQNTWADMASLGPVIRQAMREAGVARLQVAR